ncbi:TetR/AcrR family transcriptional regulator [Nocardia mexicana]|uniref:TetR family transcriptional regulator n=1 Tax=Nocardia mexicana TaxID=279262 RepID=A0A370GNH0_9NOCA|nr:TetR/AcrR family transcriptional regulator [Nocardia mexicana]RDI45272.1 TetR family transcriptional regulator [Nocardia mexicana]
MSVERKSSGVWQVSPEARTGRRRRNGPRLPPDQRREQLLDAALAVVGRDGLANLTMQAVAKQAGVAKPVLYAMYPTAPELVAALLHREHARGMSQVFDALPQQDFHESDPDQAYLEAVMMFLGAVAAAPHRWRLILMQHDGAPADYRELLADARGGLLDRCAQLLDAGIAVRGGPKDADVELIAHVMLGFVEVLGRLVLSDPGRFPPERLRSTVRALIRTLPNGPAESAGTPGRESASPAAAE